MKDIRTCSACEHWITGIPCGICHHPKGHMMATNDDMVFRDAGKFCPLNSQKYRDEKIKNVDSIILELRRACERNGIKGAVIGISGGKDSTIVAKLMVECLGRENVFGVLMPNGLQKDIDDSKRVVELLGIRHTTVNIGRAFNALYEDLNIALINHSKGVSEPSRINIAPRIRMTVLYAVAQSMGNGWRVIGTTNKSEDYIGWLTKWGDGGVDFEPIIDFTVSEFRQLGLNLGLPKDLVCKVPVDGLVDGSDEDRIGFSYDILDKYIVEGTTGNADLDMKIDRMHEYSEHKRILIPRYKMKI